MLKRAHESLEDEVAFLIEKINYLLRKVETYDKALNEFNQIKLTIDEAEENTRGCKDIVRAIKDSIDTSNVDLKCLSDFSSSLMNRLESGLDFINKRIDDIDERSFEDYERLHSSIDTLRQDILKDLESYLDEDDLIDVKEIIEQKNRYFEYLISNVHHNYLNVDRQLCELHGAQEGSKELFSSIRKDLCRFQNALVRKGVPIDN